MSERLQKARVGSLVMKRWQLGVIGTGAVFAAVGLVAAGWYAGQRAYTESGAEEPSTSTAEARPATTPPQTTSAYTTVVITTAAPTTTPPPRPDPPVLLTAPATLETALDRVSYALIGRGAFEEDYAPFVASYHEVERASQLGQSPYRPASPEDAAAAWLNENRSADVYAKRWADNAAIVQCTIMGTC